MLCAVFGLDVRYPAATAVSGVMDEKMSATAALGSYAEACPRAFMPYVEQTLAILTDMSNYWHDEARAAAYDSFQKLTLATHKVFPASTSASAVPAAADRVVLSEQSRALTEAAMPLLSSPVEDDVSKVAVTAAAAALGHLLKQLGHGAVGASHLEAAANMAKALLENNAMCQVGTEPPGIEWTSRLYRCGCCEALGSPHSWLPPLLCRSSRIQQSSNETVVTSCMQGKIWLHLARPALLFLTLYRSPCTS